MSGVQPQTADANVRPKRRFENMSSDEQWELLASGRKRVHNSTLSVTGFRRLRANNCTIRGDGNHVIGSFNILIGKNNTAEGEGNRFVVPVDPPPPPPPPPVQPARGPVQRRRAQPVQSPDIAFGAGFFELIMRAVRADEDVLLGASTTQRPPPAKQPAVSAMPAPDTEIASALDLPGDAVAGDSEETRCVVCLENQKDTLFKPCRHICCCRSCARQLTRVHLEQQKNTAFSCPKCRTPVTALTIVYI
jgi:hypothetical protein